MSTSLTPPESAFTRFRRAMVDPLVNPQEVHDATVPLTIGYHPVSVVNRSAGALVDRALLMAMKRPSMYPTVEAHRRVRRETAEGYALFEKLGWMDDPRSAHPVPPPLEHPAILHP